MRASRDGDQFHYLWAARRCLLLLAPSAELVAVAIEGASVSTRPSGTGLADSIDEIIDVAEYYGSEDLQHASAVRYAQLKHSTLQAHDQWPLSKLAKTLRRFAQQFQYLESLLGPSAVRGRFTFAFISNRPVDPKLAETVADAAAEKSVRHPKVFEKLSRYTSLQGEQLAAFARALRIEDRHAAYLFQRQSLGLELSAYLPDADSDAPIQLKELVTRKALSEGASDNVITKHDVLRALGTDSKDLFPAESRIEELERSVPRAQESDIALGVVNAAGRPALVHAEGGVGKSVFVSHLASLLPAGSQCVVYDCFGNGLYRNPTEYRHPHKVGLVEMANELSARGLCYPLIPTPKPDSSAYLRAFLHRLGQAAEAVRHSSVGTEQRLVCIVVDAADNAELAAQELGSRSFARDLIRVPIPDGVRLVFVTRTHRQGLLDPPPNTVRLRLNPFDEAETAVHLRLSFPSATTADVAEFHRLTSGNPRVQSLALASSSDLPTVLRSLAPGPVTVESSITGILDNAVSRLKDNTPGTERGAIDTICTALATLRPLIPIAVLAKMSGVETSAIVSFAFDLGRPLLVTNDTIRFRDEPTETWFRDSYRPTAADLRSFIERLIPLAASSVYAASALPPLMLEAGMLDELVTVALDATELPTTSALDRRDVELQRLQFALKASLRARRWKHAAKLALKSGAATASNARQTQLLQDNTDLAGALMQPEHVMEVVARREFGTAWTGSHHAFDAAILSMRSEFIPEARSHLRMANDWITNWSRLPGKLRESEPITDGDIAEVALAMLNVAGAKRCAKWLRSWKPRRVSYSAGGILAARLVDHGRYDDLESVTRASRNDTGLILAANRELRRAGRSTPRDATERAVTLLEDRRVPAEAPPPRGDDAGLLESITELVGEAARQKTHSRETLSRLITKFLPVDPPRGLSSPHNTSRRALLRAYALRAALTQRPLVLADLAYKELREEIEAPKTGYHQESSDLRDLRHIVGALLPWHQLYAKTALQRPRSLNIEKAASEALTHSDSAGASSYRDETFVSDEIAQLWFKMLLDSRDQPAGALKAFDSWVAGLKTPLSTRTITEFARRAVRHRSRWAHQRGVSYAVAAAKVIEDQRAHADVVTEELVKVSRALLALSPAEAAAYFDRAVEVASRVGDENLSRWGALVELADRASSARLAKPELAYRFARCAEVTYEYVARDKHFDWEGTVAALSGLCPSSCVAIASRWRDRHFGNPGRVLARTIESLLSRGDVDARTAQSLTTLRAYWDKGAILSAALGAASRSVEREALWDHAMRYARLDPPPYKTWIVFKTLQEKYALPPNDVDMYLASAERQAEAKEAGSTPAASEGHASRVPDWDVVFADVDLTTGSGLADAHRRFMSGDAPRVRERFYEAAIGRVQTGAEAAFVSAVGELPALDAYECRFLLEALPPTWRSQRGVRKAAAQVVLQIARRNWMEITASRYWQPLPLSLAADVSGLTVDHVLSVVLAAAGESTEPLVSNRMFELVALLATKLDHASAQETLDYGLDHFDEILKDTDGDGPWSEVLLPPRALSHAVAGYLWAGLGSPRDVVRWETAHAVLGLCALGGTDTVANLVAIAETTSGAVGGGGAFVDASLVFYRYNAVQWLMIALLRASIEHPAAVAPYLRLLTNVALAGETHVLVRELARRAALAIDDSIAGALDPHLRERLVLVNKSQFPPAIRKNYRSDEQVDDPTDDDDDKFYFGIDIGPYWFEPLARRFGVSLKSIERAARRVIREDWNVSVSSRWDADERSRRQLYDEREDWYSHGTRPRTDNLRFYLSYHAMMVVAGQLLAARAVINDPDEDDSFSEWLSRHSLTRADGRWLADRRDPAPLDLPVLDESGELENWRWSLTRADFDSQVFGYGEEIVLWGAWTRLSGYRAEVVSVRSALVRPGRSRSLLAALHTVVDAHDYEIPDAGDTLEISHGGYELRGWIATHDTSLGIDDRDPWAGEIAYPGAAPAATISDQMGLALDRDGRVWRQDGTEALRSLLWGEFPEPPDRDEVDRGSRVQASSRFLGSLLRTMDTDLIVKVSIERRYKYGRYEPYSNKRDRELEPLLPSARVFLIERAGHVHAL